MNKSFILLFRMRLHRGPGWTARRCNVTRLERSIIPRIFITSSTDMRSLWMRWRSPSTTISASNAGDAKNHLRDYLLAVYSHPQATGFTMWGFWDGKHDKNNAPLFYQDWTPKPALAAWEDLVLNEWRTSETAVTGSDGHAAVRGHRGEYRVTIELYGGLKKQSVDCRLSKDGDNRVDITIGTSISMTAANPVPERPPLVDAANYGTMADIPNSMRIVSPQGEKFTEGSNHVETQLFSYDFSTRLKGSLIAAVMKKQDGQDAVEAVYTGETVDTAEPNAAAAVDFSVTDAADKTVRLFVWDSVDGMRPLRSDPCGVETNELADQW